MKRLNQKGITKINVLLIVLIVAACAAAGYYLFQRAQNSLEEQQPQKAITNFDECVAAGNPVMLSYPEQCAAEGRTFTREVIDEVQPVNDSPETDSGEDNKPTPSPKKDTDNGDTNPSSSPDSAGDKVYGPECYVPTDDPNTLTLSDDCR